MSQSFLRLAGYYRRFVQDFSKITKPMTQLLRRAKYSNGPRIAKLVLKN
jgi:hypothetical protein